MQPPWFGKSEKNLLLLKGWGFNAPVITPARDKVVESVEKRQFRHDHEGRIRATVLAQVAENRDYDDVATIAVKDFAKPKHSVIVFEPDVIMKPGL